MRSEVYPVSFHWTRLDATRPNCRSTRHLDRRLSIFGPAQMGLRLLESSGRSPTTQKTEQSVSLIGTVFSARVRNGWSSMIAGLAGLAAFVYFGYIATETASSSSDRR